MLLLAALSANVETQEPALGLPAVVPPGPVRLIARHSGKCLDASAAPTLAVASTQQTCTATDAQRWLIEPTGGGYRILSAQDRRLCLNIRGAARADGARVWLSACSANGAPGEIWRFETAPAGTMTAITRHSGKCLDVSQASRADGAAILQYACHQSPNEMWTIRPYGDAPTP